MRVNLLHISTEDPCSFSWPARLLRAPSSGCCLSGAPIGSQYIRARSASAECNWTSTHSNCGRCAHLSRCSGRRAAAAAGCMISTSYPRDMMLMRKIQIKTPECPGWYQVRRRKSTSLSRSQSRRNSYRVPRARPRGRRLSRARRPRAASASA